MDREQLEISGQRTGIAKQSNLVITVRSLDPANCLVVIGCPGLPNLVKTMVSGDAVLVETPADGLLEVRLLEQSYKFNTTEFLISRISPRSGLLAGAAEIDSDNAPFGNDELRQIAASIEIVKERIAAMPELEPEQVQLLARKLDEICAASSRMGRKDWINYVAGSLTSICVTAAFTPDVTRKIFGTVNAGFTWFFASGVLLFQ